MKTSDAAKSLGIHPLNLLLKLQSLVGSPQECWPAVDEGFIETLRHLDKKTAFVKPPVESRPHSADKKETESRLGVPQVSASAAKVIEKLCRKKHWGNNRVSRRTIHNHYCQGVDNLDEALEELVRMHYLTPVPDGDAYSLNPGHKAAIEEIAQESIASATRP